jgi:hypothetical protein
MVSLEILASAPPPSCRCCGVETVIRLEHTTVGIVETLMWHCLRCHAFWSAAALPSSVAC